MTMIETIAAPSAFFFEPAPDRTGFGPVEDAVDTIVLVDPPPGAVAEIARLGLTPQLIPRDSLLALEVLPADLHGMLLPLDFLNEMVMRRPPGVQGPVLLGFGDGPELDGRLQVVRAGADGYLPVPFDSFDLAALLDPRRRNTALDRRRVLVIDDDPVMLRLMAAWLLAAGFDVKALAEPNDTFATLASFHPDMLLLDLDMPGCHGVELASAIRQKPNLATLPILFVSGVRSPVRQMAALEAGADGFLVKPLTRGRLIGRVNAALRRLNSLERLVTRDGMTGLLNATATRTEIRRGLSMSLRHGERLAVALIDVDHFKGVNDRYGHAAGDRVLRRLAEHLSGRMRNVDAVGRLGGEEFVIVFTRLDADMAVRIADQLRCDFASQVQFADSTGKPVHCSFSCGVAEARRGDTVEVLLDRADQALYAAKRNGRDQVRRAL